MTAAMLIVDGAWLRRLGRSPSQIALAIAEVAIASSRGVIRRDCVARYAVTRRSCAPDWRPGGWDMTAWPAPPWNYCLPRPFQQKPRKCAGLAVMEYGTRVGAGIPDTPHRGHGSH